MEKLKKAYLCTACLANGIIHELTPGIDQSDGNGHIYGGGYYLCNKIKGVTNAVHVVIIDNRIFYSGDYHLHKEKAEPIFIIQRAA